jgi:hypothetical protein
MDNDVTCSESLFTIQLALFEFGLGCVSCQPGEVDSAETIVDRVPRACEYIAPERITLNPDCGFASIGNLYAGNLSVSNLSVSNNNFDCLANGISFPDNLKS